MRTRSQTMKVSLVNGMFITLVDSTKHLGMQRDRLEVTRINLDRPDNNNAHNCSGLSITYHGWSDVVRDQLTVIGSDLTDSEDLDVAFRLQSSSDDRDALGILSLAHRITGELLLEVKTNAGFIYRFVDAVKHYTNAVDTDHCYLIELRAESERLITYEKCTLLVYSHVGVLLRHRSHIPNGIEI